MRNKLIVVNSLKLCEGIITRERIFQNGKIERSTLDFFVVCEQMLPLITKMVIDQEKKYILTNHTQVKRGGKSKDTDHFTMYMDVNIKYESRKPQRDVIYNFKNTKSQIDFQSATSKTKSFSDCFNDLSSEEQFIKWKNTLDLYIKQNLKKVRIRKNKKMESKAKNEICERN